MRKLVVLTLPFLGLGLGYFLWGNQIKLVEVIKSPTLRFETPTPNNLCSEIKSTCVAPEVVSCDYSEYRKMLSSKDQEIEELQLKLLEIPPAYTLYSHNEVIPRDYKKIKRHLIYFNYGYGVRGADIEYSADGENVKAIPRKGAVAGIGYLYNVPEFKVPFTEKKIDNLHIGGSVMGSETTSLSIGLSF